MSGQRRRERRSGGGTAAERRPVPQRAWAGPGSTHWPSAGGELPWRAWEPRNEPLDKGERVVAPWLDPRVLASGQQGQQSAVRSMLGGMEVETCGGRRPMSWLGRRMQRRQNVGATPTTAFLLPSTCDLLWGR